ncbi:MAG: hypothetical protein IJ092_08795 [Atopobiaceae bacterium]|nr:hypothetical protein [Atopobiaceae bacterium]
MKRTQPVLFAGMLALSLLLGGCGGNASSEPPASEETAEEEALVEEDGSEVREAGWIALSGANPSLAAEESDAFDQAVQALDRNVPFSPVALLATQQVSGTNYAFLCEGMDASWHIVVCYQNPDGETRITSSQELKVNELRIATGAPMGALLGSWQVKDQADVQLVPQELADAFAKVKDSYASATLDPIAALASRDDDGHDYLVLCEGEAREEEASRSLFVAVVHVGDAGEAQLQDVAQLEFLSCVSASA